MTWSTRTSDVLRATWFENGQFKGTWYNSVDALWYDSVDALSFRSYMKKRKVGRKEFGGVRGKVKKGRVRKS